MQRGESVGTVGNGRGHSTDSCEASIAELLPNNSNSISTTVAIDGEYFPNSTDRFKNLTFENVGYPQFWLALLSAIAGAFTQYQAVAPCVFTYHAAFLSFMTIEQRLKWRIAGTMMLCIGLTFSMPQVFALGTSVSWLSVAAVLGIQFIHSVVLFLSAASHVRLCRLSNRRVIFFIYPTIVSAIYSIFADFLPLGTQCNLGYTIWEWQSFVQVVSVFGMCGLDFIILSSATAISHYYTDIVENRRRFAVKFGIGIFFISWVFGSYRLLSPFFYQKPVELTALPSADWMTAACIVGNTTNVLIDTEQALIYGAEFVVWAEGLGGVFTANDTTGAIDSGNLTYYNNFFDDVRYLTGKYNATIGSTYLSWVTTDEDNDNVWNVLTLVDPDGSIVFSYKKVHPVPIAEADVVASNNPFGSGTSTKIGAVNGGICFDYDFPSFIRTGTSGLFIQPANTWGIVGEWHARSSAFRAIENGAYLMRCGSYGPSGLWDPYGNRLAYQSRFDEGTVWMQIPRKTTQVWTFYRHIGFVIDYIMMAFGMIYALLVISTLSPLARIRTILASWNIL